MRIATALLLIAQAASAQHVCPDAPVTIHNADEALASHACEVATDALPLLSLCGLELTRQIEITFVDGIDLACLGLYHCGKDAINILTPEALPGYRLPDSLFVDIPDAAYHDSIIVHELTHAAQDAYPCPSGHCPATSEYVAYNVQILSLKPEFRDAIDSRIGMDEPVPHDAVNATMLYLAPDRFTSLARAHLLQRPDIWDYLAQVSRGDITFDVERP